MKTNCKIGKVKLKNGASVSVLPTPERNFCHASVKSLSRTITPTTLAVGFFVLDEDRTVLAGCSYKAGFAMADLKGACEHMKDQLIEEVWGDD